MRESEAITGSHGAIAMIFILISSKLFCSYLPEAVAKMGSASVISSLLAAVITGFLFWLISKSDLSLFTLFERAFSKKTGRIAQGIFTGYLFFYSAASLHESIKIIKIYNFPETGELVFCIVSLVSAYFVGMRGLSGALRLSEFYFKLCVLTVSLILILSFGQCDFLKLYPVLGHPDNIPSGIFSFLSVYSDILLLLLLMKECGGGETVRKISIKAIFLCGFTAVLSTLLYNCVYDFTVSGEKASGILELVKNVYRGPALQRVGSVFFLMMTVIFSISVCINFALCAHSFKKTFGISDGRRILLPTATLIMGLCMLPPFNNGLSFVLKYGGGIMVLGVFTAYVIFRFGRRGISIAVLLLPLIFSGCADMHEVSDEVYAIVLAADKVAGGVRLTAAMPSYESEESSENLIYSVDAPNVAEALYKLNRALTRKVSFIHLKAAVLSEELSREGILDVVNPIRRHIDVQNAMGVAVSEGRAEDYLKIMCEGGNGNISKEAELMLLSNRYNSKSPGIILDTFCDNMTSPYVSALCPFVGENGEMTGIAVFSGDRLSAVLSVEESSAYMLAAGDDEMNVTLSDGEIINITKNASEVNVRGGKIHLEINASGVVQAESESIHELKSRAEREIKSLVRKVLRKTLRGGSDILGIRGKAAKNYLTIEGWSEFEPSSDELFVDVNLDLKRSVKG